MGAVYSWFSASALSLNAVNEGNVAMASNDNHNPTSTQTKLDQAAAGLTGSNLSLLNSLVILGVSVSKADLITKLKTASALYGAVLTARQAYQAAVNARKAGAAQILPFYAAFVIALKQALGPTNEGLLPSFGVDIPKERQQPSAGIKALAAAKAQATRKVRGTMSKQQRQAIPAASGLTMQIVGAEAQSAEGSASSGSTTSSTVTPSAASSTAPKPTP
jgi:hypothetical protein